MNTSQLSFRVRLDEFSTARAFTLSNSSSPCAEVDDAVFLFVTFPSDVSLERVEAANERRPTSRRWTCES